MDELFASIDEKSIFEAFAKCDSDGSGALEFEEMYKVLLALNSSTSEEDARAVFTLCDPDGSGEVTLVEFMRAKNGKFGSVQPGSRSQREKSDGPGMTEVNSMAQRMSAMRLERGAARDEERKLAKKAGDQQRNLQADTQLEREALEQAREREALFEAQEKKDKERLEAQRALAKQMEREREERWQAEVAEREAREKAEAVAKEAQNKARVAALAAEKEERVAKEKAALEAKEQEAEAEHIARRAEAAEQFRKAQEERHAAALAENDVRQRELQAHVTELLETTRVKAAEVQAGVQQRYEAEVAERAAKETTEVAAREEQAKKVAAAVSAEQEDRQAKHATFLAEQAEKEAEHQKRLAEAATAAAKASAECRMKLLTEREQLDKAREEEAAALKAEQVLTERRMQRQLREQKLQGRSGCAGLLGALREAYRDDALAVSDEVYEAAMRFIESRRMRHVNEITKFKAVDGLVAVLPNLDEGGEARLREAIAKQAHVDFDAQALPLSPTGAGSPGSPPTKGGGAPKK